MPEVYGLPSAIVATVVVVGGLPAANTVPVSWLRVGTVVLFTVMVTH